MSEEEGDKSSRDRRRKSRKNDPMDTNLQKVNTVKSARKSNKRKNFASSSDEVELEFEEAFAASLQLSSPSPNNESGRLTSKSPTFIADSCMTSVDGNDSEDFKLNGASGATDISTSGPMKIPTPPLSSSLKKKKSSYMQATTVIATTPITITEDLKPVSKARRKDLKSPSPIEDDSLLYSTPLKAPDTFGSTPSKGAEASSSTLLRRFSTPPPLASADHAKRAIGERWQGRLDYSNNSYYTGGLLKREDGQVVRDGKGIAYDAVKNKVYEGGFENDLKTGFGTTRYADKVYQGEYYRGLRHGYGVFIFANGEKYEGDFYRGEFHGEGKFTWSDGSRFEGTFKRGKIRRGVKVWPMKGGETYEGTFDESGQPSGFGITRFSNGSYHRGLYKHGKPHGKGEYFDINTRQLIMQEYSYGLPDKVKNRVVVAPLEGSARFIGERHGKEWTGIMFGPSSREEDEDIPEADQVRIQIGRFSGGDFPRDLLQGTYLTRNSQVTSSRFDPGPYVPDGIAATWHDLETGNARWARLGPERHGPIGSALFVISETSMARVEQYNREGELASSTAIGETS